MKRGRKELLVVGDRVLIKPEEGEQRTKVGLLLPAGAVEKEEVRGGTVVAMGPGTPIAPNDEEEPWKTSQAQARYMPMAVNIGDYALFFRKAAMEITFDDDPFLVVPHGAILVLVRETEVPDSVPEDL